MRPASSVFSARRAPFVVALVVLAFGLRAGTVWWLSDTVPYTDFALYHVAGAEIARDAGFLFDSNVTRQLPQFNWWPPAYPIFLGSVYALFGNDHRSAVWVQVLLGVITCVLVYRLAARLVGESVARAAALLVAVNPTYVFLTNQLASENLFLFWLALGLWLVSTAGADVSGGPERSPLRAAVDASVVGLVLGLGALTRAVGLVVPVVIALWWWRPVPQSDAGPERAPGWMRAASLKRIAWMLSGLVLVLAPWSARNALVAGRPALVSFGGGINFYFGHNEHSIGYQDVASSPLASIRDPAELDAAGYRLGIEFMMAQPARDAWNAVRKVGSLYAFPDYALHVNSGILVPDVAAHPELAADANARLARQRARDRWLHGPLTVLARVYHTLLLVAAGLAMARWARLAPGLRLAGWLVLAWTLVHVVYWAQPRFRAPAEIPLALLAASGLVLVTGVVLRRRGGLEHRGSFDHTGRQSK
jgi:4-amino-4-deoxy-L-arabinose transferase-like glycosyltransferase